MRKVEAFVWCEFEGVIHDDIADPWDVGPRYDYPDDRLDYQDDPNWSLQKNVPGYTQANLWVYTCPGPHHVLWIGKEIAQTNGVGA